MTITSKLVLDIERFMLTPDYWLHVAVDMGSTKTEPPELYSCLLIRLKTSTQPEVLARVCSWSDLSYPEVLAAPAVPYEFHLVKLNSTAIQAALSTITVGDHVSIYPIPDVWEYILGSPAAFTTTVVAFASDGVLVALPFPTYAADLVYNIHQPAGAPLVSGTDGVASRYNPSGYLYCRTIEDYTSFTNVSDAVNKLEAVRAEAQGLVSSYQDNAVVFEGTTEEVFI